MKNWSSVVFVFLFCFTSGEYCYSQTDNYWSWSFNTHSTLLAGAVVGGNAGPSAIYYNPALIDHDKVPSLSLSANLISLQFFSAKNIAGQGIDVDKFIFKVQPRFVSYILPNKNEKIGFEAAILTPVSEDISFTVQHFDELDIIQRTLGLETYSGYLKYSRSYDDTWVGFGLSYKLSDNFYVGTSSFLSIKVLKYQFQRIAEAFQKGDSVIINDRLEPKYIAQNSFDEEFKYWDLSFIFKIGAQYKTNNERFTFGVNLTLPNIPFIGQADVRKAFNRSNIFDNLSSSFTPNESIIELEEDVNTNIKTPFSTALGMQYFTANRKNAISLTIEYFQKIDPYPIIESSREIMDIPDYLEGIIEDGEILSYYTEANSVTNIALGFKQYVSPSILFFGGFRTDFTTGSSDNIRFLGGKFKLNEIHMNKYHITLGPVVKINKFKVMTGLQYTLGRNQDMENLVNYAQPVEYNSLTRQALEGIRENNTYASINELALFFGASIDLTK